MMLAVSVAVTILAMLGGVYLSFWLDSAPAPTVILMFSAAFVLSFLVRQYKGRRSMAAT
jgi:manganese/iron transport system permease protein